MLAHSVRVLQSIKTGKKQSSFVLLLTCCKHALVAFA